MSNKNCFDNILNHNFRVSVECALVKTRIPKEVLANNANTTIATFYNRMKDPEKITLRELRTYIKTLDIDDNEILSFMR